MARHRAPRARQRFAPDKLLSALAPAGGPAILLSLEPIVSAAAGPEGLHRAAALLTSRHGSRAAEVAVHGVYDCLDAGDHGGAAAWLDVLAVLETASAQGDRRLH